MLMSTRLDHSTLSNTVLSSAGRYSVTQTLDHLEYKTTSELRPLNICIQKIHTSALMFQNYYCLLHSYNHVGLDGRWSCLGFHCISEGYGVQDYGRSSRLTCHSLSATDRLQYNKRSRTVERDFVTDAYGWLDGWEATSIDFCQTPGLTHSHKLW